MKKSTTHCSFKEMSLSLGLAPSSVGYGAHAQDLGERFAGARRALRQAPSEVAFLFLRLLAIESGVKAHSTRSLSRT